MSKVTDKIYSTADKFFNLPEPIPTIAFVGTFTALFYAVAIPYGMGIIAESKKPINQRILALGDRPTMVFTSVANCIEQKHRVSMCDKSKEASESLAWSAGAEFRYDSEDACKENHLDTCQGFTVTKASTGEVIDRYWSPKQIAWQAATYNMQAALPLYQSTKLNQAVRYDGKVFDLTN